MVAVSAEPLEVPREAARGASLPYPVLSDADLATIDRFDLSHLDEKEGRRVARPAVFILDRRGTVRFGHVRELPHD